MFTISLDMTVTNARLVDPPIRDPRLDSELRREAYMRWGTSLCLPFHVRDHIGHLGPAGLVLVNDAYALWVALSPAGLLHWVHSGACCHQRLRPAL